MNEQVAANLGAVRDEATEMIENIAKVRGDEYAALVKALMLSSNMTEIFAFLNHNSGADDAVKAVVGNGFINCMHGLLTNMTRAGKIDEDVLISAMRDAEVMEKSLSTLMRTAVRSGVTGAEFGGSA